MSARSLYKGEIFFTRDYDGLMDEDLEQITRMLFAESFNAGFVGCIPEKEYPVCFISRGALKRLGMTFDEFMARTDGQFLRIVAQDGRDGSSRGGTDSGEYSLINKSGDKIRARERGWRLKPRNGQEMAVITLEPADPERPGTSWEETYLRISTVDLTAGTIVDLRLSADESDSDSAAPDDYRRVVRQWSREHVLEEYRHTFEYIMSPEYLVPTLSEQDVPVFFEFEGVINGETLHMSTEAVLLDAFRALWIIRGNSDADAALTEHSLFARQRKELDETREALLQAQAQIDTINAQLRKTLNEGEQYRQAILSDTVFVFNVNVSKNLIEEDFYEVVDGRRTFVLQSVGLSAPCDADEFFARWMEKNVSQEDRQAFADTFDTKRLMNSYSQGKREVTLEYETLASGGTLRILRHTVILMKEQGGNDIIALNYLKDITEQRKEDRETKRTLMTAYETATTASEAKTDFLSKMSHDIRTPMNAIIGMTMLAQTHMDDMKRVEGCLDKISMASRHMLSLLNDVLDMNKIESGKLTLREEEFSLPQLLETIKELFIATAEEKKLTYEVKEVSLHNPNVVGDETRLQQVLTNIVSNAIKYTPEGGTVTLELRERRPEESQMGIYEFICRDSGIGMSEEFQTKIFEPFERAEDVRVSKIQGTGLGMSIAKNIVGLMGGDIKLKSALGKGSTFTVTVPLRHQEIGTSTGQAKKNQESGLQELHNRSYKGRRALVVEDNELNREIAAEILEMTGLTVEVAENGQEAVDKVLASDVGYYSIILMDIQMPVMNGYEATAAIRSSSREDLKTIPVIALSANVFAGDISAATSAGMNGHLAKPLDLPSLNHMLELWL